MWAMMPALVCNSRGEGASYRPSTSSGLVTNPHLAYDLPGGSPDVYPYKTWAYRTQSGSATPGTPDNVTATWHGFPTFAKSLIGNITLKVAVDINITGSGSTGLGCATAAHRLEMSYDNGATWVVLQDIGQNVQLLGGSTVYIDYPARIFSDASFWRVLPTLYSQLLYQFPLNPSLFTTGLQDLRFRYTISTITNGTWASASTYFVFDIVAVIS